MKKLILLLFFVSLYSCNTSKKDNTDFTTLFEKSNGTETPEYADVISYYKRLSKAYNEISLFEIGETDSGEPLHLVVFNANGKIDLNEIKNSIKK